MFASIRGLGGRHQQESHACICTEGDRRNEIELSRQQVALSEEPGCGHL